MKPRSKMLSVMMLCALVLSMVPAMAFPAGASAATCDAAQFVSDVTVPDGTKFEPGTAFKKTWRLKNIGTCTWSTSYSLVFDSGEKMGASTSIAFPSSVAPGATVDLTVDMAAPTGAGHYIGYWKFKNASGTLFGIGINANKSWWVEINVTSSAPTGSVAFDFVTSAKDATWSSGAGGLSFPGTDGDAKGFALTKDKPKFESGVEASKPGLLFVPQNVTNGFIQGRYPAFKVEGGDSFQATIGCESGATTCYVAYRLDYEVNGAIKTFWTFREKFEGLTYNANISLAPLAGQEVKFILYISAYGSPAGDRALWGNPMITRKGIVPPPVTVTGTPPTATPSKTPGPVTVTVAPSSCDKVAFVSDVNVPDGTTMQPGAQFTKTWRLKNVGTCAWSTSYQLAFFSGDQMGASATAAFPKNVAVGETVDISINMTAPATAGSYRGYWMFKNASGTFFGIGAQGNKPWWVDIKVAGPTVTPGGPTKTPTATATVTPGGPTVTPQAGTALDFTDACKGTWYSGAGQLACPGNDGDAKGFVLQVSSSKLENGAVDGRPGILTFPQNVQNGYIQGFYPPFKVQSGDRFQSLIGCASEATTCYVAFRLDYQTGTDPIKTLWGPFLEKHETAGQNYSVDISLNSLAGKDVKFILTVLATGTASGDRAMWIAPRVSRGSGTVATATNTPITPTATTQPSASTYQNTKYGFKFTLPTDATIAS
ncbi:MAG: NBR1-Ig-like domain-containing protein [Anaerolineales bacterium]